MDCSEARALLSAGLLPGTGAGRSPQLGFHLSGCPACRAFRGVERFDRHQLQRGRTSGPPPPITPVSRGLEPRRGRSTTVRVFVLLALLMGTWTIWYLGLPLLRAWRDLGTMASIEPVKVAADEAEHEPGAAPATPAPYPSIAPTLTPTSPTPAPVATETPRPTVVAVTNTPTVTASPRPAAGMAKPFAPDPTDIPTPTATVKPTVTPSPTTAPPTSTIPPATPTIPPPKPTAPPVVTMEQPALVPTATAVQPPAQVAQAPPAQAAVAAPAAAGGVTVLLLGLDARPGEATGRNDAVLVARINPEQRTAALLSLPRDLWVAIPGIGEGKINSAYVLGGAQTAAATVGQALGIPIDHTVVVDFKGFRGLIDALGGITVDVARELYDPKFPTDDYGIKEAHFLPGPQVMDGETALTYSRIRHPDSDFARMRRQQAVLLGIARRLGKLGAFQTLHESDRLTGALAPYVRTTLDRGTAAQLLWSQRTMDPANVRRLVLDGSMLQETTIGGSYALWAEPATLRSLGAQLLAP